MKLTIETESPAEIVQILAAITGSAPAPAATAKAPKVEKKENPTQPSYAAAEKDTAASSTASAGTAVLSNTQNASVSVGTLPQTALTGPGIDAPVPDEAALTAAANSAIAKLGAGAQSKIKGYIADNFQKEDGTPAGLRTVRADQRARLLADLIDFTDGKKVI